MVLVQCIVLTLVPIVENHTITVSLSELAHIIQIKPNKKDTQMQNTCKHVGLPSFIIIITKS